jgi:hypothetical protein
MLDDFLDLAVAEALKHRTPFSLCHTIARLSELYPVCTMLLDLIFLTCILGLIWPISASSTYHSNCTISAKPVAFVYSPNVRGTLDILWSSLFTLFICTWTVQHLNIPRQRTNSPRSMSEKLGWSINSILPKLKWMAITILIPEFLVGRSVVEWMAARKHCKQMQDLCCDGQEWTLTHALFANMGGFVLAIRSPGGK